MAQKRTGLGKGIGALIPGASNAGSSPVDIFFQATSNDSQSQSVSGAMFLEISPRKVRPNPRQPRVEFQEQDLQELIHSVRSFGVLQPIVVRPIREVSGSEDYELVMGERRLRAAKAAGLGTIPAVVRETEDEEMLRDALLENLHRANLNPLEEASAYQQLLSDFGITQEELASRLGRSRPQVTNTLRLLRLPEEVQRKVAAGLLTAGHAKALVSLTSTDSMSKLATKIIQKALSVRETEDEVSRLRSDIPSSAKSRKGSRVEGLDEISERLADRLDTRVEISLTKTKGKIVIEFATVNDLNRILGELGESNFRA